MESEIMGTVIWYYEKHENKNLVSNKHLFGLKKLIKRKIGDEIFIYLIDKDFPDSQGNRLKEVLQKIK